MPNNFTVISCCEINIFFYKSFKDFKQADGHWFCQLGHTRVEGTAMGEELPQRRGVQGQIPGGDPEAKAPEALGIYEIVDISNIYSTFKCQWMDTKQLKNHNLTLKFNLTRLINSYSED